MKFWSLNISVLSLLISGTCGQAQAASIAAAPSALSASAVSSSQIDLHWQDNSDNEQGFIVQRSLSSTSGFVQIASLSAGSVSFQNTSLSAGTTYYYRVAAFNKVRGKVSNSAFSNVTSATTASVSTTSTTTSTTSTTTTTVPTNTVGSVLPTPTNIANGSTVYLNCGTIYQGTLNLAGKSNITVMTSGTCGKATITPGHAITGWSLDQGSIYSAPIAETPVQLSVAGVPMEVAHWPNKPQVWASAGTALPNSDLAGATLVYIDNLWTIRTQTLASNSASTAKTYYVEGKLWMLDSPGEWAISNGRIYLWSPDGQSPEGRAWASNDSAGLASNASSNAISDLASLGINANNSSGITIDGVKVFSASDGISANTSTNFHLLNTDVLNSSRDGIYANNSPGLIIDNSTFTNSARNGIGGWYGSAGSRITNNTINNVGMVGMPKHSQAGIFFGNSTTNILIDRNHVSNCSYNGISAFVGSTISNNYVDSTNLALIDGGGIYTAGFVSGNLANMNLLIEGNTIVNVTVTHAIYLDMNSNGVTIRSNSLSNNKSGIFIAGSSNLITGNIFRSNIARHVSIADTGATPHLNSFTNNVFDSTRNELTYQLDGSNTQSPDYGTFDYNTYTSTNPSRFASSNGAYKSYADWKAFIKQETHSTMNGLP